MYLKLKIEGELLQMLQQDAEESVRSATQQAMYIIKSYYKSNPYNINREVTQVVQIEESTEIVTEKQTEQFVSNEVIDDDILNF